MNHEADQPQRMTINTMVTILLENQIQGATLDLVTYLVLPWLVAAKALVFFFSSLALCIWFHWMVGTPMPDVQHLALFCLVVVFYVSMIRR